jgi:ZIP family zinc transporter
VLAVIGWGGLAASSLLLGALLAVVRAWPRRLVGLVLAFGAGALIAAVSFELALQGAQLGGTASVAAGLAAGALAYFALDRAIERGGEHLRLRAVTGRRAGGGLSSALALGAVLDGVPEQLVLGIGLAADPEVNAALLLAIFVSNVPEAVGSAADMRQAGHPVAAVWRLWVPVAIVCAAATVAGYAMADVTTGSRGGVVDGFAAGALLVMLIDSMIPAAAERAGLTAGLATVLGFAIATALSFMSV